MKFLEKDLEDIIWETSDEKLHKRGLFLTGKRYRQLNLGAYGIADLVTVSKRKDVLFIHIYELKKDRIGISAFLQAIGYARGIQRYLQYRKPEMQFAININLVGSGLDTSGNFCFLTDLLGGNEFINGSLYNIHFYTYRYEVDGIRFNLKKGYVKNNNTYNLGGYNG